MVNYELHMRRGCFKTKRVLLVFICAAVFVVIHDAAVAQDFTSSSFLVRDPVLYPAGYSTSTGYSLTSTIAQVAIGTSTASAGTPRDHRAGFLYFPFVNTPTLSGSAGDTTAALSWTTSTGILGWTVGAYDVGRGTTSGGPYTYTNVGLVTANTVTGLTNGTAYYFVVRPLDAFGNAIATSSQISVTPVSSGPPTFGSSGGGGATAAPQVGTLHFVGKAYPEGNIGILQSGATIKTLATDEQGNFEGDVVIAEGSYQLGFSGKDKLGGHSSLLTISTKVLAGITKELAGIFLSPTIETDYSTIKKGENLAISGYAYQFSTVSILVSRDIKFVTNVYATQVTTASTGKYNYIFGTRELEEDTYYIKTRASINEEMSQLSEPVSFVVSATENSKRPGKCRLGDLNQDGKVNLTDFSIVIYWYKKPLYQPFLGLEASCLNGDGVITIKDFSMMAYYWTG